MVSTPSAAGDLQDGSLVFYFGNEKPIDADELGRLFVNLARDYRRLTRRKLMVTKVEVGSLRAILMDAAIALGPYLANAAEIAKAINGVIGLGRALQDIFERARDPGGKAATSGSIGQASLKQFLKVVEKSGGKGQFEFSSKTEKIKVQVTSGEAKEVRKRVVELGEAKTIADQADLHALPRMGDTRAIVDRLSAISVAEVKAVIPVLVSVMRSAGLEFQLYTIVNELEAHGHYETAQAIRIEMDRRDHQTLPPIVRG